MTKYNLYNPATARRIIHTGVAGAKPIEILPRHSSDNVELADHIAEDLMQRFENDPHNEIKIDIAPDVPDANKIPAFEIKIDESKIGVLKANGEIESEAPKAKGRR